jgi:TetR/AcrR family transcriptional regulator
MPPVRGRARTLESSRQAILMAAEEIFARDGFSGARIDAIAERAGYNKSLIFHHFGDKLGLYQAVVQCAKSDIQHSLWERIRLWLEDPATPHDAARVRELIALAVGKSFDLMIAKPHLRQFLAWEAAEGWQTYSQLQEPIGPNQEMIQAVMSFMRRAQAAGIIRADFDPPTILALVVNLSLSYLTGLPRSQTLFPDTDFTSPEALARAREQIIGLVLHGMLAPTPQESSDATGI